MALRFLALSLIVIGAGCSRCDGKSTSPPAPKSQVLEPAPVPGIEATSFPSTGQVRSVILISVDGFASRFAREELDAGTLPHLAGLIREGASTLNARTAAGDTRTIPNHTSMLTGRPVWLMRGMPEDLPHGYVYNGVPNVETTLHNGGNPYVAYVPSVFDVAHDRGLRTGMFVTKDKFVLLAQSYGAEGGAPDLVSPNHGRGKLDALVIDMYTPQLVDTFTEALTESPMGFAFVHLRDPDSAGHASGWGGPQWRAAARAVDEYLGQIMHVVRTQPALRDHTAVIVTSDHGGEGIYHGDATNPNNHTIPFVVWGPGVPSGVDIYDVTDRTNPGDTNPLDGSEDPPVRNSDAGRLALSLLGLPDLPLPLSWAPSLGMR